MPRDKVIVVMPAYNAESTLERTLADIPSGHVDEVILVDDCSQDGTVELARRLGLTVIQHETNKGYGGNQKTCYHAALERGADVVVMIHPDYQYDSALLPAMIDLLSAGHVDVVLGNRIRSRREALDGGMPLYKYLANRALADEKAEKLSEQVTAINSALDAQKLLSSEQISAIFDRAKARQKQVGFDGDYEKWRQKHLPVRLENMGENQPI